MSAANNTGPGVGDPDRGPQARDHLGPRAAAARSTDAGTARLDTTHALYFCRTPLQSLIAQEIIRGRTGRSTVIYHPTGSSAKHRYYYDRLEATTKVFVPWKPLPLSDTLTDILAWPQIPRQVRAERFSELFISSIGSIPFSMLVARNPQATVNTFDDGSFNINPEVFPHWIRQEPPMRKLSKMLLIGVDNADLIRRGTRHFTIFKREHVVGIPYPIEELRLLSLHHAGQRAGERAERKKVRVLLGTVLPPQTRRDTYEALTVSPRFDLFLPHPAENRPAVSKPWLARACPGMDFDARIAEDVVLELARTGLQPVVYGFNSTALLTLANLVHSVSLQWHGMPIRLPLGLLQAMRVRPLGLREPGASLTASIAPQVAAAADAYATSEIDKC